MTTEFTLFPQLITELRLEIWRQALPTPLRRPLFPYKQGCWGIKERGLEPDPNGEDLNLEFDTSLLDPLRVEMPLFAVNTEARDVALKYVREQNLTLSESSNQSGYDFLRHFNPRTDTMFLPTVDIDAFFAEQAECISDPDLEDRYYTTAHPVIPRLAVTASGFGSLKGELDSFFVTCAPITLLYVIDVASNSTNTIEELEIASKRMPLDLEDAPCAQLLWRSSPREWEVAGDEQVLASMRQLVSGLDDPASSTSGYDLEIQLLRLSTREMH